MSLCDLNRIFGPLASTLPEDTDSTEPYMLDRTNAPIAPLEIASDQLVGRKSYIQWLPGCRGDHVNLIASRIVFRQLGVLCFSLMLHEERERLILHLTNPKSALKHLVFKCTYLGSGAAGLHFRPDSFGYIPQEVKTLTTQGTGFGAPVLRLTNLNDCQNDENDWSNRDTLNISGGRTAFAEVGEFLINATTTNVELGHYSIPANGAFFAAEVGLWTPECWQDFHQRLHQAASKTIPEAG